MAKVVVVEDEPSLRHMIVDEIEDLGHEVHQAADGEAGLAMILRLNPDFVCCDINMPKMNGFQLKTELDRRRGSDRAAVFLFISAKATKSDVADGLMLGADHYFTKPIDFGRLARVMAGPGSA